MNDQRAILKGRLDGKQRNRLKRLLDMDYKPSELASELGINTDWIYLSYIPLGCPHEKDKKGYILINGISFQAWYIKSYPKTKINPDEAFCKSCRQAVLISNSATFSKGNIKYLIFECPNCKRKISKIIECVKNRHEQDR